MRRPGEALSRVQLLDAAWDIAFESHSNVVDVYVRYLREKIDRPFGRHSLETVRGVGYRLRDDCELDEPPPIRIRLTLPFAAAMALVLAALGGFVYLRVGTTLLDSTDQTLLAQATEATLRLERGQPPLDRDAGSGVSFAQVLAPRRRRDRLRAGGARAASHAATSSGPSSRGARCARRSTCRAAPGGGACSRSRSTRAAQRRALVLASSLDAREESLERLRKELLVGSPLALLLATLAGYVLAGAALRPVEAMRRKASAISASTPGSRLPGAAREGRDLAARRDAERDARSGSRPRSSTSAASSPTRATSCGRRSRFSAPSSSSRSAIRARREELEDALRSAVEETDRLTALAADLLLIARADQGALPVASGADVGARRCSTPSPRASRRAPRSSGASVEVEPGDDAALEVDPRRVEQALGNLVDNALVHGRGDGHAVGAARCGDRLELHVRDEGAGLPARLRARARSTASAAPTRRGRGPGAGSASRSCRRSRRRTAGAPGCRRRPGEADVWISLPLARGAIRPRPAAQAARPLLAELEQRRLQRLLERLRSSSSRRRRAGCSRSGRSGTPAGASGATAT